MQKSSPEKFEQILREVNELLARERLVSNLTRRQGGPKHEVVEEVTRRQQVSKLEHHLDRLHTADVAKILERLPPHDRRVVWDRQVESRGGDILLELSDGVLGQLIQNASPDELRVALAQLDGDEISFISEFLPPELISERLTTLSSEEQRWVHAFMHYPSDSVGGYMSRDMVLIQEDETLEKVQREIRRKRELPEQCDKFFAINRRGELTGVLHLEKLLLCDPDAKVTDCIARDVVSFIPEEDAFQAAGAFERYDLISAPVVNERNRPIGRLTVDVIMDVVRDINTEDALNTAGLKHEEDLFAPIWASARNRWLWLGLSLLTAFLASRVIGLFEETIARYVALAALMPIVAAVGGNTGNQTTTLVVRALALEQINRTNFPHLARKELNLSLLNGLVWGSVVGVFALLVYHDIQLALVIALAMVITLILAALFALSIPLSFQYIMKRDPALGSSVLVTALTDSIGFFIFLGLAAALL